MALLHILFCRERYIYIYTGQTFASYSIVKDYPLPKDFNIYIVVFLTVRPLRLTQFYVYKSELPKETILVQDI